MDCGSDLRKSGEHDFSVQPTWSFASCSAGCPVVKGWNLTITKKPVQASDERSYLLVLVSPECSQHLETLNKCAVAEATSTILEAHRRQAGRLKLERSPQADQMQDSGRERLVIRRACRWEAKSTRTEMV